LDAALAITFKECAEQYIKAHQPSWKNEKHAKQWPATLATYAYPVIGGLPVQAIDTALVTKIIEPMWASKAETANRLRGRIEAVLDWATARGYRKGENPARWRGHLDNLLPSQAKFRRVSHHAALPYVQIGTFMAELRQQEGVAARTLEFAILTAARTGEVIGATWNEIDLPQATWTIPAARMKAGREHRVPLCRRAVEILLVQKKAASDHAKASGPVFPGQREGMGLSNMAMLMMLRRMGREDLTAHGFRSSFRDWAAEQTQVSREVAEMALAHAVGDSTETAYRHSDLLEKRRRLMEMWGAYCSRPVTSATVTPLRRSAR
jgi:integrase